MRSQTHRITVFALSTALLCTGLHAQDEVRSRTGYWLGLGMGYGAGWFSCTECSNTTARYGFTAFVRAGATLSPRLRVGGELNVWTRHSIKRSDGLTQASGNASATIYYYPSLARSLFLKGGMGLAFGRFKSTIGGKSSAAGFGAVVGVGYDLRAGSHLALTPTINLLSGLDGDQSGRLGSNLTHVILDFGVGITIHEN
jgi:hypothetical protein